MNLGEEPRVPSWPEVCTITCRQAQFAVEAWPEVPARPRPPIGELNPAPVLQCGQAILARELALAGAEPDHRLRCDEARKAYRVLALDHAFWDDFACGWNDAGFDWDGRRTDADADRDCGSIPLPRPVPH
jgi:hypothetical protein